MPRNPRGPKLCAEEIAWVMENRSRLPTKTLAAQLGVTPEHLLKRLKQAEEQGFDAVPPRRYYPERYTNHSLRRKPHGNHKL